MTSATTQANRPTPRPTPTEPRSYHFPAFERRTLPNAMRLVVAPVAKLPLVSITAVGAFDAVMASSRNRRGFGW